MAIRVLSVFELYRRPGRDFSFVERGIFPRMVASSPGSKNVQHFLPILITSLVFLSPLFLSSLSAQDLGDTRIGLVVDEGRLRANRIRKIEGKHLSLFTDLPTSPEVDELASVFDEAVADWADYYSVADVSGFHATGFLIDDLNRFRRSGVLPNGLPDFKNGYTYGLKSFWMYDQPSSYMRRQLMIHEGTHAFLFSHLGEQIPSWYNEGMAEWFASHRWIDGKLETRVTIRNREEAPYWGRTRKIRDELAEGKGLRIAEIRNLPSRSFLNVEPYAWVWAMASFLDSHPDYQTGFRELAPAIASGKLDASFEKTFGAKRQQMSEEWSAYLSDLDYNVRPSVTRIDHQVAPSKRNVLRVIACNRSWQNSGIEVTAGKSYWIRSRGRYVIRESLVEKKKTAWPCEPNGLTLEYYRGRPLGQLVAVIKPSGGVIDFERQVGVGLSRKLEVAQTGTLYFRVNESPGQLSDNSGTLLISVVDDPK